MHPNPQLDPLLDSSRLASRVAQLAEQLQTGATVDLHKLCADCPEHFEQLEMLLPTLEAVVSFERSLPLLNAPDLPPPVSSLPSATSASSASWAAAAWAWSTRPSKSPSAAASP